MHCIDTGKHSDSEPMTASAHLPRLLHIEPTTACNFTCDMCLHESKRTQPDIFLPLQTYERLADEAFASLDTLVLFGWGEPLLHPDFLQMLAIARNRMAPGGKIKVTTNGSMLTKEIIDTILSENLVDTLNISFDMPPGDCTGFPGHHTMPELVLRNLDYALCHPLRSRMHISIETVIMRSNITRLPELVTQFGVRGADSIFVSHVFPYYPQLESEILYTRMSSEAYDIFQKLGDIDPHQWFGLPHRSAPAQAAPAPPMFSDHQALALQQARENNIQLNYGLFQKIKKRLPEFTHTLALFEDCRRRARQNALLLDLPPLFGSLQQRACPYIRAHAAVIRSDGAVVPCMKNLYPHNAFFNGRMRAYTPHIFGAITETPLTDIWAASAYEHFRSEMHAMNKNIAWCGDCSFSLYSCYFYDESPHDCMLNEPFCADCPFSLDLTRCLL